MPTEAAESGTVYHVLLDGRRSHCDCIGCEQHGHCKHLEALQALLAANLFSDFLPVAIQANNDTGQG